MGDERGFTIIEVILFLAITGLLLLAALQGVSSTINNNRFSDTLKSLQANLQQQYSEVVSGVSQRDSNQNCGVVDIDGSPGASDSCIVLGRLIDINGSQLDVYTVVGDVSADAGASGQCTANGSSGKAASIAAHCPRVVTDSTHKPVISQTLTLDWGATVGAHNYVNGQGTPITYNRIAFLRDPDSEATYVLTYQDNVIASIDPTNIVGGNTNRAAVICIQSVESSKGFAYLSGASSLNSIAAGTDTTVLDQALRSVC